jgi:hypothetical protein
MSESSEPDVTIVVPVSVIEASKGGDDEDLKRIIADHAGDDFQWSDYARVKTYHQPLQALLVFEFYKDEVDI